MHLSAADLERLLECSICSEVMREPSSLLCGHSFCRSCLKSALRLKAACPLCRRPANSAASDPRPNTALASIVAAAFSQLASKADDDASLPPERGGSELPLFLSTEVQFPEGVSTLHLFEPRYRTLSRMALDDGGEFAMVYARARSGFPLDVEPDTLRGTVVTIVRIEQARASPDGRWVLTLPCAALPCDATPCDATPCDATERDRTRRMCAHACAQVVPPNTRRACSRGTRSVGRARRREPVHGEAARCAQ